MSTLNPRQLVRVIGAGNVHSTHDWAKVDGLHAEDGAELLLESATLEDVELAYLGEYLTSDQHCAMFEAISTTRTQLARSMKAFARKLDQALKSYDITTTSDAPQGDGASVGGVEISKVRKVGGIPIMVARVSLSDGQSVSLVFHSPTATGGNIGGSDVITVFRFLLNKRDVTHVVAPQNGTDISLQQVTMLMGRLIGTNSPKFQRQQSIAQRTRNELDAAVADIGNLEAQQTQLAVQAEQLQMNARQAANALTEQTERLQNAAIVTARMTAERDGLQLQLDGLKNRPPVSPYKHAQEAYAAGYQAAVAGNPQELPAGLTGDLGDAWTQGYQAYSTERDMWEQIHGTTEGFLPDPNPVMGQLRQFPDPQNKMDEDEAARLELARLAEEERLREQEELDKGNAEHEDHTSALHWYGLRIRGAGPGAVPDGVQATLTSEMAAALDIVKRKEIPEKWYAFGAVGYATALKQDEIQHYNLTDFVNVVTPKSSLDMLERLKEFVFQIAQESPDMDFTSFWTNYFKPGGRRTDQNPIKDPYTGNYDPKTLMIILRANFKDQQPVAVIESWWNEGENNAGQNLDDQLKLVANWLRGVLTSAPSLDDGYLWSNHILNPSDAPEGYDQHTFLLALDQKYGEPRTLQSFLQWMGTVRADLTGLTEGNSYSMAQVDALTDNLPEGKRPQSDFINNSGTLEEAQKQFQAGCLVYQQIAAALNQAFPNLEIPRHTMRWTFSSYMDMDYDDTESYSDAAAMGSTPAGLAVPMPHGNAIKFQGVELLKGNYTREQFEHLFLSLGGWKPEAIDEISQQINELMEILDSIFKFQSDDITEWQKKQDDIAELAQHLTNIGEEAYNENVGEINEALEFVTNKIQELSTGQRDLDTGKKSGQEVLAFTAASLNDWFTSMLALAGDGKRTVTGLGQLEDEARGYDEDEAVLKILNEAVPVGIKNYGYAPDNYETVAECIIEVAAINLNNWANSVKANDVDVKVIPFPFDEANAGLSDYIQYIQKVRTIRDTLKSVLDVWDSGKMTRPKLAVRLDELLNDYTTRWEDFNDAERASLASYLSMPDSTRRNEISRILRIRMSQLNANINWAEPERSRLMDLRKKEIKKREEEQQAILDAFNQQMTDQLNEILNSRAQYSNEVEALVNRAADLELQITDKGQLYKFEELLANVDEHLMNLRARAATSEPPATPEADPTISAAIQSARDILNLQSSDMGELRQARTQLRGIYATLDAEGQLDANRDLLDSAAQHLADLLVAIARAGGN